MAAGGSSPSSGRTPRPRDPTPDQIVTRRAARKMSMKPDANRNRPVLACLALCLTLSARAVGQDTWLKTFEVGSAMTDSGASVAPTPDGGLVVGGRTSYLSSPSWAGHATIRKLKPDGSLEWQQILGTSSVSQGVGEVRPTSDGGFVLAGSEAGEPWVVKLDAGGSVTWQRRYRALDIWQEVYSHVSEALNGDFLLAGSLRRTHNSTGDVQVVRIAPDGQLLWAKIFGGADEEFVWRLRATASGGCVVGGATWSVPASGGNEDAWVFELDPAGQVVWSKTYGTAGPHSIQRVRGLATTRDGGVIVTGSSALLGFDQDDLWVAELDAVGNVRWERTYGSGLWEEGRAISRMASGGYVVAGRSSTDAISGDKGWLLRIGADGQLLWQQILGGLGLESLTDVVASGVEHLAVVGTTWDGQGHQAMLTARIRRDGSLESCEELTETFAGVSVASSVVADFGPQVRDSDVQVFTPLAAPLAGPNVEATLCPGVVLPGQGWCFGDGSVTSCPCAVGYHGAGCSNGIYGGARLFATGLPDTSNDSLRLHVRESYPNTFGLLFQGTTTLAGGMGLQLGNGVICVSSDYRWPAKLASLNGWVDHGPGLGSHPAVLPGTTMHYQWWYRDPSATCHSNFNFANAWTLTWM